MNIFPIVLTKYNNGMSEKNEIKGSHHPALNMTVSIHSPFAILEQILKILLFPSSKKSKMQLNIC